MTYLAHHGIKGQRWGVRRFQNTDGSWTKKGLERRRYRALNREQTLENLGLNKFSNDDMIIRKGTRSYRIASADDILDDKRKYMSLTRNDRINYSESFDMLSFDTRKPYGEFIYQASKDLRLASGKKVCDYMLEKYKDLQVSDILREDTNRMAYRDNMPKQYKNESDDVRHRFDKIMREHKNEIADDFVKMNYDAIVDIEDWMSSTYELPIIMLNPKASVKLKDFDKY